MKNANELLRFLLKFAVVGLAMAFVLVWWRPQLIGAGGNAEVVHVRDGDSAVKDPPAPSSISEAALSFAPAVKRAGPAVVNIHAAKIVEERRNPYYNDPLLRRFFGNRGMTPPRRILERTLGSGVTVSPNGYILTNHHVIEGAEKIQVALHDGKAMPATIVGTDPDSDLAVLKVDATDLPAITLGDADHLAVGDIVLAIGNPYGIGQTVTMGIVSATGRSELNLAVYEDFIQTDAAINVGNSGGALIDSHGELVGINTAVLNRDTGAQGISFAIPVGIAESVFEDLVRYGHVRRGWLGISSGPSAPGQDKGVAGVQVAAVEPGGPADKAGIKPGDVITAMQGKPVTDTHALQYWVGTLDPGTQVTLTVLHDGASHDAKVKLSERPPLQTQPAPASSN